MYKRIGLTILGLFLIAILALGKPVEVNAQASETKLCCLYIINSTGEDWVIGTLDDKCPTFSTRTLDNSWTVAGDQECVEGGDPPPPPRVETDPNLPNKLMDLVREAERAELVIEYLKKHGILPVQPGGGLPPFKQRSPGDKAP